MLQSSARTTSFLGGGVTPGTEPLLEGPIVNPAAAILGSEEQMQRAQELLEPYPVGRAILAAITDPLNAAFFPAKSVGIARAALRGAKVTAQESRLLQEVAPAARRLLADVRAAPEAGGLRQRPYTRITAEKELTKLRRQLEVARLSPAKPSGSVPALLARIHDLETLIPRLAKEEAGGLRPRVPREAPAISQARRATPEGMILTNDIPVRSQIEKQITDIDRKLAKVKSDTARRPLLAERERLDAQRFLDDVTRSGDSIDNQMQAITDELEQVQNTIRLRELRGKRPGQRIQRPKFGSLEREEFEAKRAFDEGMLRREPRRTDVDHFPGVPAKGLEERRKVLTEFADNMRIEQVSEPLVGRARFTETGEIVPESTFATEAELQGFRAKQAPLMREFGTQPTETAGPLFRESGAPPRQPPAPPAEPPTGGMPPPREPPPPTGVPPEGPPPPPEDWRSAATKLTASLGTLRRNFEEVELLRGVERKKRVAESLRRLKTIKGDPEARIRAARAAFKGEFGNVDIEALAISEGEVNLLKDRIIEYGLETGKAYDVQTARDALVNLSAGLGPTPSEIDLFGEIFGADFANALRAASRGGKGSPLWDLVYEAAVIPKSFLSAFDVSYPFRQGIMVSVRHPKEFLGNIPNMFRALVKEENAQALQKLILRDETPMTLRVQGNDVSVTFGDLAERMAIVRPLQGGLTTSEEGFLSRLAMKVPGIRASARAFIVYGNKLRGDLAKYWLGHWAKTGTEITPERVIALGNLLNRLTGRGTIGKGAAAQRLTEILQATWWAPQYRLAGPQAMLQVFHRDPAIRRIAAENLVTFVAGGVGILGLLKLTGAADVELDPRSSDFGKIRIGNTRLNFWGTQQLLVRSIAQLATGERKGVFGVAPIERKDILLRYFRSGLAPEWSLAWDFYQGRNYLGEGLGWRELLERQGEITEGEAFNRLVPLAWQDIVQAVKEQGVKGIAVAPFALLGTGVQTYRQPSEELKRAFEAKFQRPFNPEVDYTIAENDPELKPLLEEVQTTGLERQVPGAVRAEETRQTRLQIEQNLKLPELAQQFASGNTKIGPALIDQYAEYLDQMSGAFVRSRIGLEERERKTPVGRDLLAWQEIDKNDPKYFNTVTGERDWETYRRDKDAAFAKLPQELQDAYNNLIRSEDLDVQRIEPIIEQVWDLRRELYDKPRYQGLSAEQGETLSDFLDEVRDRRLQLAREKGQGYVEAKPFEADIVELAKEKGAPTAFVQWAIAVHRRPEAFRNPDYLSFLMDNESDLARFFPELYDSQYIQSALGQRERELVPAY